MQPVLPLWPVLLLALAVVLSAVGASVVGLVLWLTRGRRSPAGSDAERPGETGG